MQVLTPSGYKYPSTIANGDELCAFDSVTGAAIINTVENIDFVDYTEWCRWHQCEETVPPFNWIRINGTHLLFCEQSIWRNSTNVCHTRDLVVGDKIYDDADQPITIATIEIVEDNSLIWYRFDVSGDHSYITDGLTVHNASRFWVGGTGNLDGSSTTHIAATSGGASGASYPGSADTLTWDANSGGGTTTVTAAHTLQGVGGGAFTGTWDNSVNNCDFTVSGNFGFSGAGSRIVKLGTATYTLTGSTSTWAFSNVNFLTYTGNTSANIVFTGSTGSRQIQGGGLSHGNLTLGASSSGDYTFSGSATSFASLSISAPNVLIFPNSLTTTISGAFSWNGSASAQIMITSDSSSARATIAAAAGSSASWAVFKSMNFTGSPTATNSFDLINNNGITITAPMVGGGTTGFGVVSG